ncbi:fibroblast growth factor receptor 1-A-like [Xyrichtys novacula]|uniref:receptor protein-tyrosine kinase n=1 Tax=Xyrichtys novacula TaxID=13765 RepID=A0AAV1GA39_XYRNO|nr:fibroblast growth factor receptor 1-A-like [Xyrichtys novacula]
MFSPHRVHLMKSCVLLVLLVQVPQTQSRPSKKDKVTGVRPSRPFLQAGLLVDQTAVVGSDVTFRCKVENGADIHMQWLKHIKVNGSSTGPDGLPYVKVLVSFHEEEEHLTLKNITVDDGGEYTCLVGNSLGIAHQSATLTVINLVRPSTPILQADLPADQTVDVGSDVTFECKMMDGTTATHVQWLKRTRINGCGQKPDITVLKTSVVVGGTAVLTLKKVTQDDEGEYSCVAGNSEGVSYRLAWLTVNGPETE